MQLVDIVTITIESSLLILYILLIRATIGSKLHPWVMKCLWGLLGLRVVVPVHFAGRNPYVAALEKLGLWKLLSKWLQGGSAVLWIYGIWFVGVLGCFLVFFLSNCKFSNMLKRHRELYGRKDGLLVYFVDGDIGSCLEGLIFPKIYVSRLAEVSVDWCKWIVSHELCHYRFWDNWYGFIRNTCLVLQWFNPLMWYAAKCWMEDCEIECDYRVLKNKNREEQLVYGECLVAMATRRPENFLQNVTTGNSLSDGSLKKRIGRIGEQKYMSFLTEMAVVFAMILMLAGCFLGKGLYENSWVYLLKQLPYMNERVYIYSLEDANERDQQKVIANMEVRKGLRYHEDAMVIAVGEKEVALIFSPFDEAWNTSFEMLAETIAFDREVVFVVGEDYHFAEVTEEALSIEQRGSKSFLWLNVDDDTRAFLDEDEYKVCDIYYWLFEGTQEYILEDKVCIAYHGSSIIEELKEDLLVQNPCELTEK
ncbi:MAG: M56 family metallopeptidase [Lachnospiraceae bacterium]|nr:M56 family metallopeptidase [Lachnospiraceae bacterium]